MTELQLDKLTVAWSIPNAVSKSISYQKLTLKISHACTPAVSTHTPVLAAHACAAPVAPSLCLGGNLYEW